MAALIARDIAYNSRMAKKKREREEKGTEKEENWGCKPCEFIEEEAEEVSEEDERSDKEHYSNDTAIDCSQFQAQRDKDARRWILSSTLFKSKT